MKRRKFDPKSGRSIVYFRLQKFTKITPSYSFQHVRTSFLIKIVICQKDSNLFIFLERTLHLLSNHWIHKFLFFATYKSSMRNEILFLRIMYKQIQNVSIVNIHTHHISLAYCNSRYIS